MLKEAYCDRISDDWLWREKELRSVDAKMLVGSEPIRIKAAVLITYSHWEGHFKTCASELLNYISEGVKRKLFRWTDVLPEVRQRKCTTRRQIFKGS